MQMQRSGMSGCCVGGYFYDLGGAHSKARAKTLEEFAFRMIDIGYNQINTAATNNNQTVERKYLEQLGFKVALTDKNMMLHAISGVDLGKALEPFRKIKEEQFRIAQEKKRQEALERKKREEEAAAARLEAQLKVLGDLGKHEGDDRVSSDYVRELLMKFSDRSGHLPTWQFTHTVLCKYFGIAKSHMPQYDPNYDMTYIVIAINNTLDIKRAKRLAKEAARNERKKSAPKKVVKKATTKKTSSAE